MDLDSFWRCAGECEGGLEVKLAGAYRAKVQVLCTRKFRVSSVLSAGTCGEIGYLDNAGIADDGFGRYDINNSITIYIIPHLR